MIKKLASSFSFFVFTGITLGLLTGGFPAYTNEISMASLITAMTFSLLPISFTSFSLKKGGKNIAVSLLINFGFLSTLTIALGLLFPEKIMNGFIVMAAVPTAIAVLPITTLLKGDVKYTLLSLSSMYLASFLITPFIILLFLQKEVNTTALLRDILLLIALPLVLSRFVRRIKMPKELPRIIANICFLLLVFGIIGKNRSFLFYNMEIVLLISAALFIRTFGSGILIKLIGRRKRLKDEEIIPFSLFASFKNEGMAILLCISLFPSDVAYVAAVPAVVAIIWEMIWACCLETKII
ncbi:MAG: hypothetical protein DRN01_00665 [Thermoplasmata archaeon]|nr:MAG: hypothetical protein DRN01_00665 [Thermoplasmata archaeon]